MGLKFTRPTLHLLQDYAVQKWIVRIVLWCLDLNDFLLDNYYGHKEDIILLCIGAAIIAAEVTTHVTKPQPLNPKP